MTIFTEKYFFLSLLAKPIRFNTLEIVPDESSSMGSMNQIIQEEQNISIILYHLGCPAKYRRAVIPKDVAEKLREISQGIQ
jgi:hypothetical protein